MQPKLNSKKASLVLKTMHDPHHYAQNEQSAAINDAEPNNSELSRLRLIHGAGPFIKQMQPRNMFRSPMKIRTMRTQKQQSPPVRNKVDFDKKAAVEEQMPSIGQFGGWRNHLTNQNTSQMSAGQYGQDLLPLVHATMYQNTTEQSNFPKQLNVPSHQAGSGSHDQYENFRLIPTGPGSQSIKKDFLGQPLMTQSSDKSYPHMAADESNEFSLAVQTNAPDVGHNLQEGARATGAQHDAANQKDMIKMMSGQYQPNRYSPRDANMFETGNTNSVVKSPNDLDDRMPIYNSGPNLNGMNFKTNAFKSTQGIKKKTKNVHGISNFHSLYPQRQETFSNADDFRQVRGQGYPLRLNVDLQQIPGNQRLPQEETEDDPIHAAAPRPKFSDINSSQSQSRRNLTKLTHLGGDQVDNSKALLEQTLICQAFSSKKFHSLMNENAADNPKEDMQEHAIIHIYSHQHNMRPTALTRYRHDSSQDEEMEENRMQPTRTRSNYTKESQWSRRRNTVTKIIDKFERFGQIKKQQQNMYHQQFQHVSRNRLLNIPSGSVNNLAQDNNPRSSTIEQGSHSGLGNFTKNYPLLNAMSNKGSPAHGVFGIPSIATAKNAYRNQNRIDPLMTTNEVTTIKRLQLQNTSKLPNGRMGGPKTPLRTPGGNQVPPISRNMRLSIAYHSLKTPNRQEQDQDPSTVGDVFSFKSSLRNSHIGALKNHKGQSLQIQQRAMACTPNVAFRAPETTKVQKRKNIQLPQSLNPIDWRSNTNIGFYQNQQPTLPSFDNKSTHTGNYLLLQRNQTAMDTKRNKTPNADLAKLNPRTSEMFQNANADLAQVNKRKSFMTTMQTARDSSLDSTKIGDRRRNTMKLKELDHKSSKRSPPRLVKKQQQASKMLGVRQSRTPMCVHDQSSMASISVAEIPQEQVKRVFIGDLTQDQFKMSKQKKGRGPSKISLLEAGGKKTLDPDSLKSKISLAIKRKVNKNQKKAPSGFNADIDFKQIFENAKSIKKIPQPCNHNSTKIPSQPKIRRSLSKLTSKLNADLKLGERLSLTSLNVDLSPERQMNFNRNLTKAKYINRTLMSNTANKISHVSGKMMSFSKNSLGQPFQPEVVFNKDNGFQVNPLEARYLQIPLRTEEAGFETPLIIYIAKFTPLLDAGGPQQKLRQNLREPDLQVFVSKTEEYPNEQNHDLKFNLDDSENQDLICKIEIASDNKRRPTFDEKEDFVNLGLYSMAGMPKVALIYGFSNRLMFSLKKQLIANFNNNPFKPLKVQTTSVRRPQLSSEGSDRNAPNATLITDAINSGSESSEVDMEAATSYLQSPLPELQDMNEFKIQTQQKIQDHINAPFSKDTITFLKSQKQMKQHQNRRRKISPLRLSGTAADNADLRLRQSGRTSSKDQQIRLVLQKKESMDLDNLKLRTFQLHKVQILKTFKSNLLVLKEQQHRGARVARNLLTNMALVNAWINYRSNIDRKRRTWWESLRKIVVSKRLSFRQRRQLRRYGPTLALRLKKHIHQAFNFVAASSYVGLCNSRTLKDKANVQNLEELDQDGHIKSRDKCGTIIHWFLWNHNRRVYQFLVKGRLFMNRMTQIQIQYRRKYLAKNLIKTKIVERLMEYKSKMIEFFVFNNKKNKNKYAGLQKKIISDIDWPLRDNAGELCIDKTGLLWRAVCDWLELYNMNFQINFFRWQDMYSDIGRIEPGFIERLLRKYQSLVEANELQYDPDALRQYPMLQIGPLQQGARSKELSKMTSTTSVEQQRRDRKDQQEAIDYKGKKLITKMASAISKVKIRNKKSPEELQRDKNMLSQLNRGMQDQLTRGRLKQMGVEPMELDSICPPEAAMDFRNLNYQEIIYKMLVVKKCNFDIEGLVTLQTEASPARPEEPANEE